jgi:branched-chain amino acid transport system ATP-binding protein
VGALRRRDGAAVATDLRRVEELFPVLGERAGSDAGTLSGGEQQMLAVGRALMSRPRLLLLDEPSLGLAPLITRRLFETLPVLREQWGVAMLVVEQNANLALQVSDRAVVLESGRVALAGPAAEVAGHDDVRRAYLGVA